MKKLKAFIFGSFFIVIISNFNNCSKRNSDVVTGSNQISIDEIVYDNKNNETTIDGFILLISRGTTQPIAELGTIEKGIIKLALPELEKISYPNKWLEKIEFDFPEVKVEPPNTSWIQIDDSMQLIVFAENENGYKQEYILECFENSGSYKVQYTFFTNDVNIKGKGKVTYFGSEINYDFDINAKEGWNILFTNETSFNISIKTQEKNVGKIFWVVEKKEIYLNSLFYN